MLRRLQAIISVILGLGACSAQVDEFSSASELSDSSCVDRMLSGDESDVDCGGSCTPCAGGAQCDIDDDCLSGACTSGLCDASCDDHLRNGDETGIDCGGSCLAGCGIFNACHENADCTSLYCRPHPFSPNRPGYCARASCTDGIRNGREGGVDCGGSACPTGCPNFNQCYENSDCLSGYCRPGPLGPTRPGNCMTPPPLALTTHSKPCAGVTQSEGDQSIEIALNRAADFTLHYARADEPTSATSVTARFDSTALCVTLPAIEPGVRYDYWIEANDDLGHRAVFPGADERFSFRGFDERHVAVVLLELVDSTRARLPERIDPEFYRDEIFRSADSIAAYFDEQSFHQIALVGVDRPDGDVYGPIAVSGSSLDFCANSGLAASRAAQQLESSGVDLSRYDHLIFVYPYYETTESCVAGMAIGDRISIFRFLSPVIAHEMGHSLGLDHASSLNCLSYDSRGGQIPSTRTTFSIADPTSRCFRTEYGDGHDIMGSPGVYMHTSTVNKVRLGWLPPWVITQYRGEGEYIIARTGEARRDMLLEIPRWDPARGYFYVEYRQRNGRFDEFDSTDTISEGVTIRYASAPDTPISNRKSMVVYANPAESVNGNGVALPVGHSVDLPDGYRIETLETTGDHARIRVSSLPFAVDDGVGPVVDNVRLSVTNRADGLQEVRLAFTTDEPAALEPSQINHVYGCEEQSDVLGYAHECYALTSFLRLEPFTPYAYQINVADIHGNRSSSVGSVAWERNTAPRIVSWSAVAVENAQIRYDWAFEDDNFGGAPASATLVYRRVTNTEPNRAYPPNRSDASGSATITPLAGRSGEEVVVWIVVSDQLGASVTSDPQRLTLL